MDPVDIGALYRKFGPVVYRRCRKLLCEPEAAQDATQEVFVRAVRHAERLVSDRECLPWLYRVTTNLCLNVIREAAGAMVVPLDGQRESEARGLGAEQRISVRETIRDLLRCFDTASAEIAVLAYLDQMTQEEIAQVTGLSRRTVGKKLKLIGSAAARFAEEREEGVL